jgi:hypothetical protein
MHLSSTPLCCHTSHALFLSYCSHLTSIFYLETKTRVESIRSGLACKTRSRSRSIVTGADSSSVNIALVGHLGADELRDDIDLLGGAVVESAQVSRLKGLLLAAVGGKTKGDGRVAVAKRGGTVGGSSIASSGVTRGSVVARGGVVTSSGIVTRGSVVARGGVVTRGGVLVAVTSIGVGIVVTVTNVGVVTSSTVGSVTDCGSVVASSSSTDTSDGSCDFIFGEVIDTKVLSVDASCIIVLIVAGVTGTGWVANLARRESRSLVGHHWVTTNRSDLTSELFGDLLVECLGSITGRVLVLLERSDLRVDGLDGLAGNGSKADRASVSFQSTVDESHGHALDITSCLGVGEGLVSYGLLEAVCR